MTETPSNQDPQYPHDPFASPPPDAADREPTRGPSGSTHPLPAVAYERAATPTTPATTTGTRRRGAFAASVITASLLVGGGAGVGGAALWTSHESGDGSPTAVAARTTSSVVDAPAAATGDGSVESVAQAVLPSVVEIVVSGPQGAGSGSGIVLSSDGQILTNNHVVELAGDTGTLQVKFSDGSHAEATIVGADPLTDTAVIQAKGVSGLTPATIGSSDSLKVGQGVVAIGSPFGLDATVTSGIVSALDRPVDVGSDGQGNSTVYPAIQTDAAINPGNSGGPLVDLAGHVVGINASIQTTGSSQTGGESGSIGLGFAIPIDEVQPVIDQLAQGEAPTHARLGISVENVASGAGAAAVVVDGAQVTQVNDGSAAAGAGLQGGDVITKVDDHLIEGADSLVATVRSYRPGDQVTVTYTRSGGEHTVTLTLDSDASATNS